MVAPRLKVMISQNPPHGRSGEILNDRLGDELAR
jgi:hypothetical protein